MLGCTRRKVGDPCRVGDGRRVLRSLARTPWAPEGTCPCPREAIGEKRGGREVDVVGPVWRAKTCPQPCFDAGVGGINDATMKADGQYLAQ